ncbi:hypothetical protein [Nocardia sp. alder85J]|uniref:hypothetical protein n=1 Tax=Nocardia sp. alder85J TaxID=2862949 RepID=UPI001CD4C428|nr:hypothetical protein [Nocardia sp. alder85J]MCX4094558.1 hypothetical protein [Nocardia sp. alder85J]
MSQSMTLTEAITATGGLFDAGDPAAARRQFAQAIAEIAEPDEIALMMQMVRIFEGDFYTVALADLRTMWSTRPHDRRLLELCVPHSDPQLYCPPAYTPRTVSTEESSEPVTTARESDWFDDTDPSAGPRRVRLQQRDEFYRRPSRATKDAASTDSQRLEARRAARRPCVEEPREVLEYFATRYMQDDDPEHLPVRDDTDTPATRPAYAVQRDVPVGYGIDFDKAAMYPVFGWRCVSCFIERAVADARPRDPRTGEGRSDDGLCDSCRDAGMPGIPALDPGYEWGDEILAFCSYLTITYPAVAKAMLREQYRRSPEHMRAVIAAGVLAHPEPMNDRDPSSSAHTDADHPAVDESLLAPAA